MKDVDHSKHRVSQMRDVGEPPSAFVRRAGSLINLLLILCSISGVVLCLLPYGLVRYELSIVFGHYPKAFSPAFWNDLRFSGIYVTMTCGFVLFLSRLARRREIYRTLGDHLPNR